MKPNEDCLTVEERTHLQKLLDLQKLSGGRRLYFEEALAEIFPGTDCYYYRPDKKFILSLPYEETEINRQRVNYLRYCFFDITAEWQLYWHYPVGIIGRKKTMRLNEMKIYGAGRDV